MTTPSEQTAALEGTAAIARDLIRFDTSNFGNGRSNGESDAAEYVVAALADLGVSSTVIESEPGRTSVVARVAGRNRDKPALVVHGHLDVVPAVAEDWSVDPFGGVVKDGMLWGRGAVDMKNMDAMIIGALQDILGDGEAPERDLVIAFFADEEAGGVLGSHYLVRERPELFEGATEAISEVGGYSVYVEKKRAYLVQTGEKALIWATLVARGTAGHGSQLNRDNPVSRLAGAVARIGAEDWPLSLTNTTRELVAGIADILGQPVTMITPDQAAIATGSASRFIQASLRNTTNPTGLAAGYKHNVIPDAAEATVDIRIIPGEEEAVLDRLRELAGAGVEVRIDHRDIGLEQPFTGALVEQMKSSLHRFDPGAPVLPYLLPAGTDNKALSILGITGYGFAPLLLPEDLDFAALFHGVDERVPLDALVFGRQVLRDLLTHY